MKYILVLYRRVYHMLYKIRNFFDWIVKVISYSKLLWNDFDWDFTFILILLQYKIKRTRNNIGKYGIHEGKEKDCMQMKEIEDLLTRMIDDEWYGETAFKEFNSKWGELRMYTPIGEDRKSSSMMLPLILKHDNENTENSKEHDRELLKCSKREETLRQQDYKKCFNLLAKNIRNWWD